MDSRKVYDAVNRRYGSIAKEGSAGGDYESKVSKAFGYTDEDLASAPEGANLGLGCGNPVALANLREGETIIDLGCGGGLDVITAARKIGPSGVAIGVDMNKDMLQRASTNASKAGITNVRFIECPVTKLTLRDATADCIISNCVINLVPASEKQLAFHEMYRVLKPGGRVAISDILARKELPEAMKTSMALHVGCIAGASQLSEYEKYLVDAGFEDIRIIDSKADLNVYLTAVQDPDTSQCCQPSSVADGAGCCGDATKKCSQACQSSSGDEGKGCCDSSVAAFAKAIAKDVGDVDFNEWAGSFQIYALKPENE